jgi:hypothetical protein
VREAASDSSLEAAGRLCDVQVGVLPRSRQRHVDEQTSRPDRDRLSARGLRSADERRGGRGQASEVVGVVVAQGAQPEMLYSARADLALSVGSYSWAGLVMPMPASQLLWAA